jgi:hypothetical protein
MGLLQCRVLLLTTKATDTLAIDNSEEIDSQLTYLQDQKLLTLHWRSLPECGGYRVALSIAYYGG